MSERKRSQQKPGQKKGPKETILGALLFGGVVVAILLSFKMFPGLFSDRARSAGAAVTTEAKSPAVVQASNVVRADMTPERTNIPVLEKAPEIPTMEINNAVMVTVELDFGPTIPSIAEALNFIERRSEPADGTGRTFAVLDAYGGPTADNKKLHISMHVSSEKPGLGALVFTKTKEILWQAKMVATTNTVSFTGKNLSILLDTGTASNKVWLLDGSAGPASVMDATVRDLGQPVRDVWPEGAEREVTFIYSACGCPVKVMARRSGERTVRTKEMPVIFPDDPPVVGLINKLMGW